MDPQMIETLLVAAREAYASGGWLALASLALVAAVNAYQADWLQVMLPRRFQWDEWPLIGKVLFVFGGSFAGALTAAIAGSMSWSAALISALGVGLAAALGHKYVLAPAGKTAIAAKAAAAMPVSLSRAVSLITPFDAADLAKARVARAKRKASESLK